MDAPCSPWATVDDAPCEEGTDGLTAEGIAEGIELADPANVANYSDGLHFTAAGADIAAPVLAAALG